MVTPAEPSPKDGERVRHGISFEAWAFVVAGLGEGLAEDDLLAHLGLDAERWQLASAAFHEDVLDDVEAGGTLTQAFDEAMRAARRVWSREIPPLDADLRAWLDYHRAWATAESPMAFLEAHGLKATDILRLQDHWQERLTADDALGREALAILQEPAGPAPTPRPKPPRLPTKAAAAEGADVTMDPQGRGAVASLPFAEGASGPFHHKLSVPLPESKTLGPARVDETRMAVPTETSGLVLPFLTPTPGAERVPATAEEAPPSQRQPERLMDDSEHVALSLERYAALCADLIDTPDCYHMVLMRYGINASAKLALDVHWTQRMAEDVALWLAWDRACAARRAGR